MQELIKELKEADATLENDGYKSWCYTRLAIAKAIEALQKPILDKADVSGLLPQSTETFILLAGGRTLITGTFDECKDYADKLVKPVGVKLNIVNVVYGNSR